MLHPDWYLPDVDWFSLLPTAPRRDDAQPVISQVSDLIGQNGGYGPASTVVATYLALLSADHLLDEMTLVASDHNVAELARLVCGLSLVQAYLTQTVERIAEGVEARGFRELDAVPATRLNRLQEHLRAAFASGELFAGQLKAAHRALSNATRSH